MKTALKNPKDFSYGKETLLMLSVPSVMAFYYFGPRVIRLLLFAVVTAYAVSIAGSFLIKCKSSPLSPNIAVTAVCVTLMMSASASYSALGVAVLFAIAVAALPFGNGERLPFVPAAAGVAFITLCRGETMFLYPSLSSQAFANTDAHFVAGTSLAALLSEGNSIFADAFSVSEAVSGAYTGAMGATCALAIIGTSVYLLFRQPRRFLIFISYVLSAGVFAAFFPRILTGSVLSVTMELSSGMLLFSGLFLLCAPQSSPRSTLSSVLYGITAGMLVMLLRMFGIFEDSSAFAVLIMNAFVPLFSKLDKGGAVS